MVTINVTVINCTL